MRFQTFTGEGENGQASAVLDAMNLLAEWQEMNPHAEIINFSTAAAMTSHTTKGDWGTTDTTWWHTHTITIMYCDPAGEKPCR